MQRSSHFKVILVLLGNFTLFFTQNIHAQYTDITKVIDYQKKFEAFSKRFPVQELPFGINQKMMDKGGSNQQILSELEINTFLKQMPLDTNQNAYLINYSQTKNGHSPSDNYTNAEEKNLLKLGKVKYFIVKKLNIRPNTSSLIVYFLNKSKPLGEGLIGWKYILFNFNQNGKLINSLVFAQEEYFMTRRYSEGLLTKNEKNELIFETTEVDYQDFTKKLNEKPQYEPPKRYFLLGDSFHLQDISDRVFPYAGTFKAGNELISIEQNVNSFAVLCGKVGAGIFSGQELLKYDLKLGTFSFKHDELGVLSGTFSADYNEIVIKNEQTNVVTVYKRE
jgi:hypothetical protein